MGSERPAYALPVVDAAHGDGGAVGRHTWFWVLILALAGLAIGLAFAFQATVSAVNALSAWSRDYVHYERATQRAGELELEFWRLMETASFYVMGEIDRSELEQRLRVIENATAPFEAKETARWIAHVPDAQATLTRIKAAIDQYGPVVRSLAPGDVDTLARLRGSSAFLGPLLRRLMNDFETFEVTGAVTEVEALRDRFKTGGVMVGAMVATSLVLISLLLVELRNRRRLYESVVASREEARVAHERAEAALREAGHRFRTIATANPIAVLAVTQADGAIRYANSAAAALLGLAEDATAGTTLKEFLAPGGGFASSGAAVDGIETSLRRRNGDLVPVTLSARPIEYEGVPCLVVGIVDQTERHAARLEIERQREIIAHREKLSALGALLAGVAHELNNPLSVVVAQAAMLEEMAVDAPVAARGSRIRAAAERCAGIVKTFLAMARQRPASRGLVDVNRVASASLDLLDYSRRSSGIKLAVSLGTDLPEVWADKDQIGQVTTNLIVNAQQALSEWPGLKLIEVSTSYDRDAGTVRIAVGDSGPGVPEGMLTRIFEPFFTTKPAGVGTGIGLSVCRSIVASHGGTIEVQARAGGGATFLVVIPAGLDELAVAETPAALDTAFLETARPASKLIN